MCMMLKPCYQLYAYLVLATCATSFLCFPLPGWCTIMKYIIYIKLICVVRVLSRKTGPCYWSLLLPHRRLHNSLPSPPLYPSFVWSRCGDVGNLRIPIFNYLIFYTHRYNVTPETLWGILHGFLGLSMIVWWQGTLHYMSLVKK